MAGNQDSEKPQWLAARLNPVRGDHHRGEIEILDPRLVYDAPYVQVFNDRVRFPDGREGESFRWYWTAPYGVIALPRCADGSILLLEQFRHMDRSWRLEAPRGFGQADETPEQAAAREVAEETGRAVTATRILRRIGSELYPVYLALVDVTDAPATAAPDEAEAIRAVHPFAQAEIPALMADPRIHDAETLVLLGALLNP